MSFSKSPISFVAHFFLGPFLLRTSNILIWNHILMKVSFYKKNSRRRRDEIFLRRCEQKWNSRFFLFLLLIWRTKQKEVCKNKRTLLRLWCQVVAEFVIKILFSSLLSAGVTSFDSFTKESQQSAQDADM